MNSSSTSTIAHEEISRRAHDIWEQCGRLDGQEIEHWLRAESELQNERKQAERFRKSNGGGRANRLTP